MRKRSKRPTRYPTKISYIWSVFVDRVINLPCFAGPSFTVTMKRSSMPIFFVLLLFSFQCYEALPFGRQLNVFAQVQAQAACVALWPGTGWVSAVPRTCKSGGPTCDRVCQQVGRLATDGQRRAAGRQKCINSLHVYDQDFSNQPDFPGLKTYKYNSCGHGSCGPNYCCCVSF